LDFVAKSDSGSVANLLPVPEPAAAAMVAAAILGMAAGRRRL
jgi:hypothetical protein